MYQRDYIVRMIEMIAELVAGILGLIKKGEFKKASQSIESAYRDILRQDAAFFQGIPLEELTDKLIGEHNYTNGHLEILSELFFAQAELSYAGGNKNESLQYYKKSLTLLDFIINESKSFSLEKQTRQSYIMDRMDELKID